MKDRLLLVISIFFLFQFPLESYAQKNLWIDSANFNSTGLQELPSVAFLGETGNFVVVWNDQEEDSISFRRFDPLGNPLDTSDIYIPESDAVGAPSVASIANGDFIIVWIDVDEPYKVYAQYVRSNGQVEGGRRQLNILAAELLEDCGDPPNSMDIEGQRLTLYSDPIYTGEVRGVLCFVEDRQNCDSSDDDTVFLRFFQIDYTNNNPLSQLSSGGQFKADSWPIQNGNEDFNGNTGVSPDGTFIVTWRGRVNPIVS